MAKNGNEYKTEKAAQGQENCHFFFFTDILPFLLHVLYVQNVNTN